MKSSNQAETLMLNDLECEASKSQGDQAWWDNPKVVQNARAWLKWSDG